MRRSDTRLLHCHVLPIDELHHHLRESCPCKPAVERLRRRTADDDTRWHIVSHNEEPGYSGKWTAIDHDESAETPEPAPVDKRPI